MPPVDFILARLWKNMELQAFRLTGIIRTPAAIHPIVLKTKGREMIYEVMESPLHIRVNMGADGTTVETRPNAQGQWRSVTGKALQDAILQSDITYEELALDFFNWPRIEPVGADSIKTFKSYALDAFPEGRPSRYAKIRFWVTALHCLMIRADAYDAKDQVVKRVEVNGVQEIDKAWAIKEMQIATMIPGRDLSKSRTYIEIRDGKRGAE